MFDNQSPLVPGTLPPNAEPGCGLQFDHFGQALAVGDFNGDGFKDILVGGGKKPEAGEQGGGLTRMWLMATVGGPGTWQRRQWYTGNGDTDLFGFRVGTLKDLNADSRDEMVASAPAFPTVTQARGKVYVTFGPPNDPSMACTITSPENGTVVLPGPPIETAHTFAIEGTIAGVWLGTSFAMGDLDGNGLQDMLVGAPGSVDKDLNYTGRVFVIMDTTLAQILADVAAQGPLRNYTLKPTAGTPGLSGTQVTPNAVLSGAGIGQSLGDRFGQALAFVGNIDGLPGEEFVVGAPEFAWDVGFSTTSPDRGYVEVHRWNSATGTAPLLVSIPGTQDGEGFGWSVSGGININPAGTDPAPDILVGAILYDATIESNVMVDAGRVRVFSGTDAAIGIVSPLLVQGNVNGTIMFGNAGDRFGFSVAGGKSINAPPIGGGPATDDIVVGSILHSPGVMTVCGITQGSRQAGTVYIFDSAQITEEALFELRGEGLRDRAGWSVVLDNVIGATTGPDARSDIILGALAWDQPGVADVGRGYVFDGLGVFQ